MLAKEQSEIVCSFFMIKFKNLKKDHQKDNEDKTVPLM